MKVIQINSSLNGSTGMIARDISNYLNENHIDNYLFYTQGTNSNTQYINYSSKNYIKLNALKSRILGNYGFNSNKATDNLIKNIEEIQPDIVHIHNIHGHDVNLEKLVCYLNDRKRQP